MSGIVAAVNAEISGATNLSLNSSVGRSCMTGTISGPAAWSGHAKLVRGDPGGARTLGLRVRNPALYPLRSRDSENLCQGRSRKRAFLALNSMSYHELSDEELDEILARDWEVRLGPRPPRLRPHQHKTGEAGPEALLTSSLPIIRVRRFPAHPVVCVQIARL